MSSFRVCPKEKPGVTRMEFDYYHTESGDIFEEYFRFVRQVAIEDFELCEKAQENLEKGVYTEGILNPVKETGVVCKQFPIKNVFFKDIDVLHKVYQQRVLDLVCSQHEGEKKCVNSSHMVSSNKYVARSSLVEPTTS
jgi:hypothetical protein